MKEIKFRDFDCLLKKTKYKENGNLSLLLVTENNMLITRVTVNHHQTLPKDVAFVKNNNENEGVLKMLENEGYVEKLIGLFSIEGEIVSVVKFRTSEIEDII